MRPTLSKLSIVNHFQPKVNVSMANLTPWLQGWALRHQKMSGTSP